MENLTQKTTPLVRFTPENFMLFIAMYKEKKKAKEKTFEFEGEQWLTSYAKHAIDYLKSKFKEIGIVPKKLKKIKKSKKPSNQVSWVQADKFGNKVIIFDDDRVVLRLFEQRERFLGVITDRIFYTNRSSRKHLFHNYLSYGFNYALLNSGLFDSVCLTVDKKIRYKIPTEHILVRGKILHFKHTVNNESFELQTFYSTNLIVDYLIS